MLTDTELNALLDAHDALVSACVDERLSLIEFLAAYDDFPRSFGLDGRNASADERWVLRRSSQRIAFHFRVLETVSGPTAAVAPGDANAPRSVDPFTPGLGVSSGVGEFLGRAMLLRLRQLLARHPDFKAPPAPPATAAASQAAIYSV